MIALLSVIIGASIFSSAYAIDEQTHCYDFLINESPMSEGHPEDRTERWCYKKTASANKETYIFNADGGSVRPELALLVGEDGVITHTSLHEGELTVHRVNSTHYNPFSIPLTEPSGGSHVTSVPVSDEVSASAENVRNMILSQATNVGIEDFSLMSVAAKQTASASYKPWRGFWWPTKNMPILGPLAKYDSFVKARSGSSPGAVDYEKGRHYYKGVSWEGHCNGWAASSILRTEPRSSRSGSGVTFSVSDLKGLYAELDYCANTAFFGSRYNGSGDIKDISPALFHKTLKYYIGNLRKPVVMDYMSSAPVDNHVASGYSMQMTPTGPNSYSVKTKVTMHRYDSSASNSTGAAPTYSRTYRYSLTTDANGNPTGGSWKSENPDFIWVPLSPARCSSNNQRLSSSWVQTIQSL